MIFPFSILFKLLIPLLLREFCLESVQVRPSDLMQWVFRQNRLNIHQRKRF